jgi:hypothetical protein
MQGEHMTFSGFALPYRYDKLVRPMQGHLTWLLQLTVD